MYMIEITEDKYEDLLEHVCKGLKHLGKAKEFLEEMKEESSMNERYGRRDFDEERDYEHEERYGNRQGMRRSAHSGGGRYSRY